MQRRALLSTVGAAAFAGCLADDAPSPTGDSAEPSTPNATDVTDATTQTSETETATATPPDVGVVPTEAAGPPWDDDVKRVVAWPDVTDETPVALTPATQRGSLPTATVEFTLTNDTDVRFDTNFYAWRVWKRVDGEWFHVAPRAWNQPLMSLAPDESHAWTLTVDNTRLDDEPLPRAGGTEELSLAGLGGGTYAFTVDGWFAGEGYRDGVGFVARFDLDGDPVELTPTDEVTATTRDGDAVVVETDRETGGESRLAAFVVERVESSVSESADDDVRRLVTEQALRDRKLRNTLSFFEAGVETVRLQEQNSVWPVFGVREPRTIAYDGVRYRLSAEEL
ncbi:hypothetical protein SAMN04487948_10655 [Halogranum amylolyticum]|uniref:Uncharacterized protein n=1 Tax=Halogranum amylolyticum TaxID=660520 RepID=A0A1H8T863_9EURY|nr:hypothetical protein [Halogranum amylolyticum]SEO86708.1 hypothetical protein SAMN04487948_10655 [Halogranum amylolyticum]